MRTLCIIFFDFSALQLDFFLDYWNKTDDFWNSLRWSRSSQSSESVSIWSLQNFHDHPDLADRTQLYPSDRGRLMSSGSFAIVRVAFPYDRFADRLNIIWDDWDDPDDHVETRLKGLFQRLSLEKQKKENCCPAFASSRTPEIRKFQVVDVRCTKKHDARAKLLFCQPEAIAFSRCFETAEHDIVWLCLDKSLLIHPSHENN